MLMSLKNLEVTELRRTGAGATERGWSPSVCGREWEVTGRAEGAVTEVTDSLWKVTETYLQS